MILNHTSDYKGGTITLRATTPESNDDSDIYYAEMCHFE